MSPGGGATAISNLRVLANQPALFGDMASVPTTWRTLEAIGAGALEHIASARTQARAEAWAAGVDPSFYVIDIDATLVGANALGRGDPDDRPTRAAPPRWSVMNTWYWELRGPWRGVVLPPVRGHMGAQGLVGESIDDVGLRGHRTKQRYL